MQSKIQIRCTDGVAIGYAMSENDWSCLHDVYESLFASENGIGQKASYVLQTYWRDLTSGFEFAGPYFLREVPLDGKFLHDIIFKVISTLEKYRFHVILLVGDGASCNLALFKRLCGYANEQLPVEDSVMSNTGSRPVSSIHWAPDQTKPALSWYALLTRYGLLI